jgi:hypothetical protein
MPENGVSQYILMNSIPSFLRYAAVHNLTQNPPPRDNRARGPVAVDAAGLNAIAEAARLDNLAAVEALLVGDQSI